MTLSHVSPSVTINLFIFGRTGLHCCEQAFLFCSEQGLLQCAGFSLRWFLLLQRGLQGTQATVLGVCSLSSFGAWA